jgi:eukaryotic-like serine/threonine-protein kinase
VGVRQDIPPDTLLGGKIRLIKRIGRGGMGDVWIARNEATHAELAVKTLHRSERTPVHDERFRREARLSATISHRNVVRVFDLVDEADGTIGLVMELLRGGTLEDCLRDRGPLSSIQTIAVALPVLAAMHHVHQKGIIHRDMKPANVFFAVEPDGHVIPKVLDFGIAKLPAAGSALTMDGSVLGTPHYMSPEQIRGHENIDGRSDMFSLAVALYEMLTGTRVFHRDSASASLAAVLEHEVDPDPRIEPRLWIAISRALAKRPYERYASCAEFGEALRAAVEATDEQVATALQELRPQSTSGSSSTTGQSSIAIREASMPQIELPRRWGIVVTAAVATGAATLAVGLTLILMRPSSTAVEPPPTAASEPPQRAAITAPPSPSPSPSPPSPRPPSSASAASEPTPSSESSAIPAVKPGGSAKRGEKRPKPKGDVATTPGF